MLFRQLNGERAGQKASSGAFCRWGRFWLCLIVMLLSPSASAQLAGSTGAALEETMVLVVVPQTIDLNGPEVDRWIGQLKAERERRGKTPEEIPILRLAQGDANHRKVLRSLGLDDRSDIRTYSCSRDARGWPVRILAAHEPPLSADAVFARALPESPALDRPELQSVGLLIVSRPDDGPSVEAFLKELGRFWMTRYGRVRPSPYPLASYDLSRPELREALSLSFPQLVEDAPLVAVCVFHQDQPLEILEVFRDLELPASLVRRISAARSQSLQGPGRALSAQIPAASTVGVSPEQERLLLVMRLQETARQLWGATSEDQSRQNQGSKRLLLRIIEESRRYTEGELAALELLQESLRDYTVEPLTSEDPKLLEAQARLLQLSRALERDL